jgi:outer membrane protein assembly factor BamA
MWSITACNVTLVVPVGEQLLVGNKIERSDSKGIDLSDEQDNLKQRPNKELLGFIKFHLWAYQYGNKGLGVGKKKRGFRKLMENIGEAPSLVDSNKMELSTKRLSEYYFSKGYLENQVTYSVVPRNFSQKRASVTYSVNLNAVHSIHSLNYVSASGAIDYEILASRSQQKLNVGQRLDFENIEAERTRLNELLRNRGFYYFNSSFIDFQIDTNQRRLGADVVINIRNGKNGASHQRQTIEEVVVRIGDADGKDTLLYEGLHFLEGSDYIKPVALSKNINFGPGDFYNASDIQKTYSNLLSMGLFNFVTIRFHPSSIDSLTKLAVEIILQTAPRHDFTWEPQAIVTAQGDGIATNQQNNVFGSEQSAGIANVFSLANRNVFGGGETFSISSFTALETQLKRDNNGVNSFRQSLNMELTIPSLLFFEQKKFSQIIVKKNTRFNASFLHDQNINFSRYVVPFSFTYSFTHGRTSFNITPFRLSINQASVEGGFLASLDPSTRFYTSQLLTNNLIAGPSASLYWTNEKTNPLKYWQIRSNAVELSGNLASVYFNTFTDQHGIDKEIRLTRDVAIKYSQYARSDIDASYNHIIDENNALAYRLYAGAGVPYGNTVFLPFERRFFVGGGSGLRAWRPRTIGPGSYSDSANTIRIEKTGELMLQGSAEFRFDILDKVVDGAVFADAGNIWNFRRDPNFVNAEFQFDRFYKEIALNSGVGLRFDLRYVVFRTDWGIALHDPSKLEGNKWVIKDFFTNRWIFDNTAINFAIGFPF